MKKQETIIGKFQGGETFGFLIPEDRDYYGGDFYVKKAHFGLAETGDRVEGVEIKSTGKKPEVRIIRVFGKEKPIEQVFVEGIYSKGEGNFGFIDVEGLEKGYFVYGDKRNGAKDGDKVKAQIIEFKGKKEAIVVKVFSDTLGTVIGRFKDSDKFGFVIPDESKNNDVFIPGHRKNGATDGDMVEAKIVKVGGKNREGIILRIII
ncbi:MAG: hypothetical protein PHI37_05570 [Candidatus Gracilibacteria bacterium]|nr:hypothetical protein [Candidatus Gracilibacteria bacterium]